MMEEEIPCFLGDSAMIYRTLQELEEEGAVLSEWELRDTGRPIKNYRMTDQGWKQLYEAEEDIKKRTDNHLFFLDQLGKLKEEKTE